jgi:hypothetical protein
MGGDYYYEMAAMAAGFNGVYAKLADTALRTGCHIGPNGLAVASRRHSAGLLAC